MVLTHWLLGLVWRRYFRPTANSLGLVRTQVCSPRRLLKAGLGHSERLESRVLLTSDFGDAPDLTVATGIGDYQTLLANGGPAHVIDATQNTLFLGARVDGEANAVPGVDADGDDRTGQPDDEDGLIDPIQDLVLTVGTGPVVQLRATNTTGTAATLYGWIDYNRDGVFDPATERASATVPTGTNKGTIALTFPVIPTNTAAGNTYARFRLSSDASAANPTGTATGGEVEDYVASINQRTNGTADSTKGKKIASGTNGGPTLVTDDFFGIAVASLGDLDGDGVNDLAVGAYGDDTLGTRRGAVYIEFMNSNGTVKNGVKLANTTNGGPALANYDYFGSSLVSLGDLDGDGIQDLAVGASGDDTGGSTAGAVHVLFLNSNGTVKNSVKIASGLSGGPALSSGDRFGTSVATLGDMDGDGITELAVGASGDNTNGFDRGAVHILRLNSNGTVKSSVKIADNTNGGPALNNADGFGNSLAALGDLDGDGVVDLAVGAKLDDTGGTDRGAVHVLLLNAAGTVKSKAKLAHGANGTPGLVNNDQFGFSLTALGDLDGDGVTDLGVGATNDDTGGDLGNYSNRGALNLLLMNSNGSVKSSSKLGSNTNGGPALANNDHFGSSVTLLGDLNGDGLPDLAVGTYGDDTGGSFAGAVHVLFLKSSDSSPPAASSFTRQNPLASRTDADVLVFRATFNEAVVNVNAADFLVTGTTATVTNVALVGGSNGTQYDITISGGNLPNLNGTVGLNFAVAPTINDLAGNALPAVEPVIDETYLLDNAIPNLVISPNAVSTNAGQITFTFQFSEAVTGFDSNDITLVNASKGTFTPVDADTYTLVVTPLVDGPVTVTVPAAAAQDASGLSNLLTSATVTSDRTAPSLVITPNGTTSNASSLLFTFQFSETVSNFVSSDITVTNGTRGTFTAIDGDTYTLAVTPLADGVVTVNVASNAAQDAAGNGNTQASASVTSDRAAVTLTVVPDQAITNASQILFTIQFSESVTGFDSSDIVVTNGSKGLFSAIDSDTYTLIVNPIADGTVTTTVLANAVQDVGENTNVLTSGSAVSDRTAPALTITPNGTTTNASQTVFTFQFSETVTQFDISDITVSNGTKGTFTAIDGDTYTLAVTAISDGIVTVNVASNAARDAAGNGSSQASASVTADRGAVSLTVVADQAITNASQITFTIQFSESVTGFDSSDIVVTNGSKGLLTAVDSDTYTLVVSPIADGTVTTTVLANAAQDAASNTNVLTSGSAVSDRTLPGLTISPNGTTINASQVVFTFQFTESVTQFDLNDITVSNGNKGTFTAIDADTYTLSVNSIQNGTVSVNVGNVAVDAAGNSNVAASASVNCQLTPLSLEITPKGALVSTDSTVFTFQFGETVSGFDVTDIEIINGIAGAFINIDGDTYTLEVFTILDGLVSIHVNANAALNSLSNGNAAATTSITCDRSGPAIVSSGNCTVNENTLNAVTVVATDSHGPVTFSILGGVDSSRFLIDESSGLLRFLIAPDFELPADSDADNIYLVQIKASDVLGLYTLQNIVVTVAGVNDNPPQYQSPTSFTVEENTTFVDSLIAVDTDFPSQAVRFTITGGVDASKFTVTADGQLTFITPPNFESPADAGGDNLYQVTVTATDDSDSPQSTTCNLEIEVIDADESPTDISLSKATVSEQQAAGTVVGILSTADPDSGSLFGYSLISGLGSTDNAKFRIVGNQLQTNTLLNFATQPTCSIRVQSTDSTGLSTQKVFTISVSQVISRLLELPSTPVTWFNKSASVKVLPQIVVTNGVNFAGGSLNVSIVTVGTKKASLDVVQIPAIRFGTSPQLNRMPTLTNVTVQLGSNDSAATIQQFLRGIAFSTKGKGVSTLTRTLRVTLSDANGHSTVVSQLINVRKSDR